MDSDGESDVRVNSTRNSSSHCSSSGSSRDDRSLAEDEKMTLFCKVTVSWCLSLDNYVNSSTCR